MLNMCCVYCRRAGLLASRYSQLGFYPRATFAVFALAVAGVCGGCGKPKKDAEVWTPRPQVSWQHVAPSVAPPGVNQYKVFVEGPTNGLFPANAAVTRIALEPAKQTDGGERLGPQLSTDPRNEFLQWNSVFDDQMAISEVFPINQRDLGGGQAEPDQVLAAFRGLRARLGLIYAFNELSPSESEMFGVLYDVDAAKPLAAIHARAESMPIPADAEEPEDPYHLWKTDSRALVRQRFAEMAHVCMRTLIQNDTPTRTDVPPGWTPAGPVTPPEWPPRRSSFRGRQ